MALRILRSKLWAGALAGLMGCSSNQEAPTANVPRFQGVKIVAAGLGDAALIKSVAAQRGEWRETRGADVEIQEAPVDPHAVRGIDVLVFPADRLGDLVDASALAVLPDSLVQPPAQPDEGAMVRAPAPAPPPAPDPFAFSDVLPAFRDQVTKYGSNRMALPYGATALVLVYRRDAMEGVANLSAAKEAGIALEPPRTWELLDALAKFFHGRDWDGNGEPEEGVALALGPDAEGVGDSTFLARAAALGQHRDQFSFLFDADTMEPRIASPPFVEALASLVALREYGPPNVAGFDADAAREAFRSGKVALLIDRAELASRWTDPKRPIKVGVAALPGSGRVYDPERKVWETVSPPNRPSYLPEGGGWLVGVVPASAGREHEAALDFIKYLASPETSQRVRNDRAFPMLPTRATQLGQGLPDPRSAPGVDPRQWSRAVSQTLTAPRVIPGLRIPQADGYLDDLGKARAAAASGEPAESALATAARAWTARTEKLGVARQLWHYRRSLNSLATAPEPPPH
jgi:multiple sugar transport system substrate-binding protein